MISHNSLHDFGEISEESIGGVNAKVFMFKLNSLISGIYSRSFSKLKFYKAPGEGFFIIPIVPPVYINSTALFLVLQLIKE